MDKKAETIKLRYSVSVSCIWYPGYTRQKHKPINLKAYQCTLCSAQNQKIIIIIIIIIIIKIIIIIIIKIIIIKF